MTRVRINYKDFPVERSKEIHSEANSSHSGVDRRWQPVQHIMRGLLWYPSVWQQAPEWASKHYYNINHSWKEKESHTGLSWAVDQSRELDQQEQPLLTLLMWHCLPGLRQSPACGLMQSWARLSSKLSAKDTGKLRMSHMPLGSFWPSQSLWSKVLLSELMVSLIIIMALSGQTK